MIIAESRDSLIWCCVLFLELESPSLHFLNIYESRAEQPRDPSAFFSATPQPTPLPSPTGSNESSNRRDDLNTAAASQVLVTNPHCVGGTSSSHRRHQPRRNEVTADIVHRPHCDVNEKVKMTRNNLDRPVLILTMPSVSGSEAEEY